MSFYQISVCATRALVGLVLLVACASLAISQVNIQKPPAPYGADDLTFGASKGSRVTQAPRSEIVSQISAGEVDPAFAAQFDQAYGFAYSAEEHTMGRMLLAGSFKSVNGHATESIVRFNADRSVDTTFRAQVRGTIFRLIVQTDGKILIGGAMTAYNGTTSRYGVARLHVDGSLDTSFNAGTGPNNLVRDIALQPDGKVIVVGEFSFMNGIPRVAIARLNSDGAVDESFTSPIVPSQFLSTPLITGVALGTDGRIVVTGPMYLPGDPQVRWVLRLHADGGIDASFSPPAMNSNAWKVAVQPDNKIVLTGFFTTVASTSRSRIARLNPDGTLDMTFNPGTGANASTLGVRVLSNGKVAITGTFNSVNGNARGGLAVLNGDGSVDASFAPSGTTAGSIYGILPTASGYYVHGSFSRISGSDRDTVAYLNADGSVDQSFTGTSLQYGSVRSVIPQPGGKVLVGGFFNRLNGSATNSVVRLNADASIDSTFANGVTIAGFVTRIVVQPDGKLLVMGSSIRVNNGTAYTVVRLNADGTPDASFTLATLPTIFSGYTAAIQADGKILFSYQTNSADPTQSGRMVRLNPDGSLDGTFTAAPYTIQAISVLPNGQVLVAGDFSFAYVDSTTGTSEPHSAVIRLNADGSHDRTFRSAFTADIGSIPFANAMYVQADGKVLVAGRLFTGNNPTPLGVVRLNATGTVDGSFQTNSIDSLIGFANVHSLYPTSDGKILAGGHFDSYGSTGGRSIVRLEANGVRDPSFGAVADNVIHSVAVDSNNKVVIGGTFSRVNGVTRAGVARLLNGAVTVDSVPFDFDGDGKTDIGIFRPILGAAEWWINRSGNGQTFALQFGSSTDRIAPADYTGDGKADIAFFRPSSGEWYVLRSEDFSFFALPFGTNGDVPVPGDYDADGKADFAVFRPSNSTWFISQSSGAPTRIEQFGVTGDQPVVADYDGDNKADVGIFRNNAGVAEWWINRSTAGVLAMQFGASTDKAVQGDYTGDGKADIAIWRPSDGNWLIVRSEDFSFFGFPFGANGDVPSPGDYDGDGKFDPTVFRPSSATWFIGRTTAGTQIVQFGATGDRPIPNAFVP